MSSYALSSTEPYARRTKGCISFPAMGVLSLEGGPDE